MFGFVQILVVDDGSTDTTTEYVLDYMKKMESRSNIGKTIRLARLLKNKGKGGAIKTGVRLSYGRYILMVSDNERIKIKLDFRIEAACHQL